jgi:hypothetical protein
MLICAQFTACISIKHSFILFSLLWSAARWPSNVRSYICWYISWFIAQNLMQFILKLFGCVKWKTTIVLVHYFSVWTQHTQCSVFKNTFLLLHYYIYLWLFYGWKVWYAMCVFYSHDKVMTLYKIHFWRYSAVWKETQVFSNIPPSPSFFYMVKIFFLPYS